MKLTTKYQLRVSLNGSLYPLWFHANISLSDRRAAMLEKPLDKRNIITITFINLGGIPLPEAVCADALISKNITDKGKLLLYRPLCQRKYSLCGLDGVAQAIILNILLNNKGNGEHTLFPCFLLCNLQAVAVAVVHNVGKPQIQDIGNPQAQVSFQNKRCRHSVIRSAGDSALAHSLDDFGVLFGGQGFRFLVHFGLSFLKKFVFRGL